MSEPVDDSRDETSEGTPEDQPGRGRKRRRRRGRGRSQTDTPATESAPAAEVSSTLSSLTAGLFSHVDEREVPCKVDGCTQTWTWSAEEQIRSFGQPPPKRMCAEHVAQLHALADREVPCSGSGCTATWHWPRTAQVTQLQKTGSDEPPTRLCDACKKAERELGDIEVPCRIEACTGTWRWTREAQLKHRAWARRADEGPREPSPRGSSRRRKRRRGGADGPPSRLCEGCRARTETLVEREVQCKVHGCTRMVVVDRESQLRAWVALKTDDASVEAPLPKRMCEVCREFCRLHEDRQVPCGRPGCDRTWTYKTGAQLQAFLAGRLEDPVRLCETCRASEIDQQTAEGMPRAPEGTEIMPCIVSGCAGVWFYGSGMSIAAADDGDLPLDRMCDACRESRQAPARYTAETTQVPAVVEDSPAADGDISQSS